MKITRSNDWVICKHQSLIPDDTCEDLIFTFPASMVSADMELGPGTYTVKLTGEDGGGWIRGYRFMLRDRVIMHLDQPEVIFV